MSMKNNKVHDRIAGAVYGFAIGDAMGATTEFMTEAQIAKCYGKVTDIIGGGWLSLKPGSVTDDTEMMLCVCRALMQTQKREDVFGYSFMRACRNEFVKWFKGNPKDVGGQCAKAIKTMMSGKLAASCDDEALGNGGLMRALPCAVLDRTFLNEAQGRLTHNNDRSTECIEIYHRNIVNLIKDVPKRCLSHPTALMEPTGCVYNSVNNALYWASSCRTFEDVLIGAVNHGGDADTIGALAGGLAGARFGANAIPNRWIQKLDPKVKAELDKFIKFACKEVGTMYDCEV